MEAEVEDFVDLSVGVVCKNYEEPGPLESAAIFYSARKWRGIHRAGRRWRGMH